MSSTNENSVERDAHAVQQQYYELLPEWTFYQCHEHKYLYQNIGFAIYGPPTKDQQIFAIKNKITDDNDAVDIISYGNAAKKIIDGVYNQIMTLVKYDTSYICYAVIYNVIFFTKNDIALKDSKNDKALDTSLHAEPIFKIRKRIKKGTDHTYQILYIDKQGRVYTDWSDYKNNNTLPKCTMLLPKDGIYQLNPHVFATETNSSVWLELVKSPACSTRSAVLQYMDLASCGVGALGIGCSIAAAFTPAAPVVLGASVCSILSGVWTFTRSTGHLIDKASYKESLKDKSALGSWIAVSGSAFSLAASGGSALLTKFAKSGQNIKASSQAAYNCALLGSVGLNGFGIGYQAYCMYDNYRTGQPISLVDIASLSAHILFFGNSVLNLEYAGQLINNTQNNVLRDYAATLRSRRLRKSFNRAKQNAANHYTNKQYENADIIRYIQRKLSFKNQTTANNYFTFPNTTSTFNGKIVICGVPLLDIKQFVSKLISDDKKRNFDNKTDNCGKANTDEHANQIFKNLLEYLLKSYALDNIHINFDGFNEIFKDLFNLRNGQNILILLFQIAIPMIERYPLCRKYFYATLQFLWKYIKQCIEQVVPNINFSVMDEYTEARIYEFILSLLDDIEKIAKYIGPSVKKYISFIRTGLETLHSISKT